jgi:surfeit locus 1 family protein
LPPLVTVAGIVLTAAAGNWQIGRAHEKQILQQAYDRGQTGTPVRIGPGPVRAEQLRMQRVEAEGQFVPEGLVLLDNKTRDSVAGYEVIMPLKLAGSSMHVLVKRGWIAGGRNRATLPEIKTPRQTVTVTGTAVLPGRFYELSSGVEEGPVWQNLTIERYARRMGLEIQPILLQQESPLDDGLLRSWERPDFGIARHYGYAVQWFLLCGLLIFLYVFFYVKSSRSKKNQTDANAPGRD